ncbi:MAG: chemotaxis response regulator protein-glutamate methylesterase [Peptococcaceae bacterium]|jgi:two-component system chemotaxis response regulator CheB|nr:chemotaxis response regulator protein-glutamate methylesterase [Peptococcaceae bacterium]
MSQFAAKIRVLVVDDSLLFRKKLELSLNEDPMITVIGSAADPLEARQKIAELRPDVLTLDVEMPHMNGIEFLKQLIPTNPLPVVVVSSLPLNALDALSAGAVDFVRKPQVNSPGDLQGFLHELRGKIKIARRAKVQSALVEPRSLRGAPEQRPPRQQAPLGGKGGKFVVCIGASTGGTEAIIQVVKDLPANTPGVLIVQHMPANFTNLYAQRLDKICQMSAKEAEDNDRVLTGRILVAAGDYHLTLRRDVLGYYIRSQKGEKVSGHCPSVDVMFHSAAEAAGSNCIGVILTGMGADGARGITQMRQAGAYTIGQNEETCVVYGMPMEAWRRGGIARQLPLRQIGPEIIFQLNRVTAAGG